MKLQIKWLIPDGWSEHRYCLVNESGEVVCHRAKLSDAREEQRRMTEQIYEGRTKSKPSILAQCREMESKPIPKPEPGEIKNNLYPSRA